MTRTQLEKQIKDVIRLHYRQNLWVYRPGFDYDESMAPFVRELADLAQDWLPTPPPPLGYKAVIVNGKRKIVVDPVQATKIREIAELCAQAPDVRVVQVNAKKLIEQIKKDTKDPKQAKIACGMIEAAANGHKEMAGILARMIRAEWKDLAKSIR